MKNAISAAALTLIVVVLAFTLALAFSFAQPTAVAPATPAPATPVIRIMDDSLTPYAAAWQLECERRFPGCLVLLTHGGTFVHGQWCVLTAASDPQVPLTDIHALLDRTLAEYPGRTICLLACNEVSYHLTGYPSVYYSPSEVWCCPDRNVLDPSFQDNHLTFKTLDDQDFSSDPGPTRWQAAPAVVGNVFELIQAN